MKINRKDFCILFAAFVVVPFLAISGCVWMLRSSLPSPSDVVFSDIVAARSDAQMLMDALPVGSDVESEPNSLDFEELPPSLRIQPGVYAFVYRDHVSIVLHSNPEFMLGARIWRKGAIPPTRDEKTAYEDITFFEVDKNLEKRGENQL